MTTLGFGASDALLVNDLAAASKTMKEAAETYGRLLARVVARAREREATELIGDTHVVRLEWTNSYDQSLLRPLLEVLDAEDLLAAYIPEHEKSALVPGRFDLGRLRPIARKRGKPVMDIVDRATFRTGPKVTLVERNRKDES